MAAKKKREIPDPAAYDDVPEFTDFGDLGDLRDLGEIADFRGVAEASARARDDDEEEAEPPKKPAKKARPASKSIPEAAPPKRPPFRDEETKAREAAARREGNAKKDSLRGKGRAAVAAAEAAKAKEKEKEKDKGKTSRDGVEVAPVGLRIIGGKFRRKRLEYGGDQTVRPMKDRVREALFNLLGPDVVDKHALDLFAGTGAIGLEALSRGAARATFVERHFPTADVLRANIKTLDAVDETAVFSSDTFYWWNHTHVQDDAPRLIFVCPPYDLFVTRKDDLEAMIRSAVEQAAPGSVCVVESDERWSASPLFDDLGDWDVRDYPPARIALLRKE